MCLSNALSVEGTVHLLQSPQVFLLSVPYLQVPISTAEGQTCLSVYGEQVKLALFYSPLDSHGNQQSENLRNPP